MGPLDSSASIPKESGVCRTLVSHHAMELTAHSFPAPRGLLLEAEQLLTECFLSHTCGLKGGAGSPIKKAFRKKAFKKKASSGAPM